MSGTFTSNLVASTATKSDWGRRPETIRPNSDIFERWTIPEFDMPALLGEEIYGDEQKGTTLSMLSFLMVYSPLRF